MHPGIGRQSFFFNEIEYGEIRNNFLLILSSNIGWSQKKALDTTSYKLWRRVDAPNISEDGKWVTYHFVHIDSKYDTLPPVTYLYNPEKNIKVELKHVVRPSFLRTGNGYVIR